MIKASLLSIRPDLTFPYYLVEAPYGHQRTGSTVRTGHVLEKMLGKKDLSK